MANPLVIVPCGQRKIWHQDPAHGPTAARDAYTGAPFALNRAYAERFGGAWLILSAKYGFVAPDFQIPGPYNVTFKRRHSGPIALHSLRDQVRQLNLGRYPHVVALGGADYRQAVEQAFSGTPSQLSFPTAGLPIGKAMQAIRRALDQDAPLMSTKTSTPFRSGSSASSTSSDLAGGSAYRIVKAPPRLLTLPSVAGEASAGTRPSRSGLDH